MDTAVDVIGTVITAGALVWAITWDIRRSRREAKSEAGQVVVHVYPDPEVDFENDRVWWNVEIANYSGHVLRSVNITCSWPAGFNPLRSAGDGWISENAGPAWRQLTAPATELIVMHHLEPDRADGQVTFIADRTADTGASKPTVTVEWTDRHGQRWTVKDSGIPQRSGRS